MNEAWIDTVFEGSAEDMAEIPDESAQTCVTSPPYWGPRDYDVEGQLGQEADPLEYLRRMMIVMEEVWRILKPDGTLWLNLGDSYFGDSSVGKASWTKTTKRTSRRSAARKANLKPKDLVGMPWRVALELQDFGWWLRSDIIWAKPNPMPGSYMDRPTSSHEYIFLLSKAEHYYYDDRAIAEPAITYTREKKWSRPLDRRPGRSVVSSKSYAGSGQSTRTFSADGLRKKRDVWTVATKAFAGAHFAVYPPELITPCVLAGSRPGDLVLDPFMGSGTTALVALQHRRHFTGYELNPDYHEIIEERIAPLRGQARLPVETPPPPGFGWGQKEEEA